MRRFVGFAFLGLLLTPPVSGDDCSARLSELGLPLRLKYRGKPKQVKWEQVEKTMTMLRDNLSATRCELRFEDIFESKRPDALFPLISNLIRTIPEESLQGVGVYSDDEFEFGSYSNRVVFERTGRRSYKHYYFQFMDPDGNLQAAGNRSLIDIATGRPTFFVKWNEIRSLTAFLSSGEVTP